MSRKKIIIIICALFILSIPLISYLTRHTSSNQFTTFDNLSGPKEKTIVPPETPTEISDYEVGSTSRMAVLITNKDSKWLDLIKGFKSIGIPVTVTTDYRKALQHKVVFVYPYISGVVIPGEGLKALFDHPKNGGTLLAVNVLGGGLQTIFGFDKVKEGQNNKEILFSNAYLDLITPSGKSPNKNEKIIKLANKREKSILITSSYVKTKVPALATFENGEAAITQNAIGTGHAYAFGIDLGQLFYIGFSGREEDIARTYVNHYEPTIDVFLRFIKSAYLEDEPNAVTIGTTPEGKELSVILSHDVDYASSVFNSLAYSDLEKSNGVSATYFLQVKYLKDFNDKIFFDQKNIEEINQVANKGMEIGSHSISHSRQYSQFPLGDGLEHYPDYKPFVIDRLNTRDGTVLGELRVSKFLIEKKTVEKNVISFRPGELSNPFSLPQSLLATGFKYSSTATANNSLTHLPFQLSYNRESAQVLPIYEFPVTIEDEEYPNMINQIPDAIETSEAIANYGGLFVVLIHPNVTGHKLEFERRIIEHWKQRAWFGNLSMFGDWWSKRDNLSVDIENKTMTILCKKGIKNLTLQLSNKLQVDASENIDFQNQILTIKECKDSLTIALQEK